MTGAASEALIAKHRGLALGIARRFVAKAPPNIERAEVEHLAIVGLFEWVRRHPDDADPNWRFGAVLRIRGAIIDDLRRLDCLSRTGRAAAKARGDGRRVIGLDDIDREWAEHRASAEPSPEVELERKQLVAEALRAPLIERDREIIRLRFFRDREVRDVAAAYGISEPRITQHCARALGVMRAQLDGNRDAIRRARAAVIMSRRRTQRAARAAERPSGIYPKETLAMPVPTPVSAPLPIGNAVASTLPDEGLDLVAEIGRYQAWLVDQALIRTSGNRAQAARLLGINRTTLVEMLKRVAAEPGRRNRAAAIRELRDSRRAAGLCWVCGATLDGSMAAIGSHVGQPHARCEACRERRRRTGTPHAGTLNAHLKNDRR